MIKGIGTDIVDLSRLKEKDERFVHRILSDEEWKFYQTIQDENRKLTYLGGRFAAKEALFKAISKGDGNINYRDFVIINDEHGKPVLHEKPEILDKYDIHLSISHTDTYALAYVIIELK